MGRECYPLLKGGRREAKYSHGYPASDLQTLASIAEVLLPLITSNNQHTPNDVGDDQSRKAAIDSFFQSSASQYPVPDEVAELIEKRGFVEAKILVRTIIKIMSTRVGTLLICGSRSVRKEWAYLIKFSEISLDKREKVVQQWFKHWLFTPVRVAFVFLKLLLLFIYFTQGLCSTIFCFRLLCSEGGSSHLCQE